MAIRRSRRGSSFRGRRKPTTWEQIISNFNMPTAATTAVLDLSNQTLISNNNSYGTCLRMIGRVTIEHGLGEAATELADLAIGVCVVTKDAAASLTVPDPQNSTDRNQDWYYWDSRLQTLGPAGADGGLMEFEINIHTARRLRGGYRLIMVFQKQITELTYRGDLAMRLLWTLQ